MGQGSPLVALFDPNGFHFAEWNFRAQASKERLPIRRFPKEEDITGRRQFAVGDENIECLEYLPVYMRSLNGQDSSIVFVDCRGSGQFDAGFAGAKALLPSFYRILEGTKELK